jgi:phenylalanyl-tRNA synthetase alpha subunit
LVAKLLSDARERIQAALQASPEAQDVKAAISQMEQIKERETRAMVERRQELERTARQVEENKQQGDKLLNGEARLAQWHSFVGIMKDKVRSVFGDAGYQRLADAVNAEWANHPDNLTKPPHQPAPPKPSGSSGPSGP